MPKWSAQDYNMVAVVISETISPNTRDAAFQQAVKIASAFAIVFKDDNPNFKHRLFMDKCGVTHEEEMAIMRID